MTLLSWATPLYLLALYGAVRFFTKPARQVPSGKVAWTPLESVTVTLAIYFGAQFLGGLLVVLYPLSRRWNEAQINDWFTNNTIGQFALVVVIEALTLGLLYLFLRRRQSGVKAIGLRKPQWRDAGYALIGFGLYFLLYIVLINVAKSLVPNLDLEQQQQIGFEQARGLQLALVFVSLVILPPFVEELLARGFLYTGLKNGLPKVWAVLVTSGLFAIAHLQAGSGKSLLWVAAVDTFTLSLVLIYLREKTGGLAAPIGLHMVKNCIAFLSLFVFNIL